MFGFIKKIFLTGLTVLSSLVSTASLSCILMNNKECKVRPKLLIVMLIVMSLYFILLVLKQVNIVAVVIILMMHMQKYVFLML